MGVGMVAIVVGAIAIVSISSMQNTQYSKNQIQATKLAQQNMELVRSIKESNYGVCLNSDIIQNPPPNTTCSSWEDVWGITFGAFSETPTPHCATVDCTFTVIYGCNIRTANGGTESKPICLNYSSSKTAAGSNLSNLTSLIIIEDEATGQKKVTSRAYWSDTTGEHLSNLITIFSKY